MTRTSGTACASRWTATGSGWTSRKADLTETEYKILKLLMQSPQRIFPVQVIYETVWGEPYFYVSNGTVMVHIRNLRMAEPPHCDKQALLSERYYRCV